MKKMILTSLMVLLMVSAFAYEKDDSINGTFHVTVNSLKDNEFEFDEIGVWLNNCEIIVTIHLNPDSILDCYEVIWDGYSVYPSTILLSENNFIENYGDSVKLSLKKGIYDCDDEIWIYVHYRSHDEAKGQRWLKSETFKVVDYVQNEECLNAYDNAMTIETPVSVEEDKNQYFDLAGRRLTSPPSNGIYIRGGKKVVVHRR